MSEPVLYDRNGEPICVGDRFKYQVGRINEDEGQLYIGANGVAHIRFRYRQISPVVVDQFWFDPYDSPITEKIKEPTMTEPLVRMGRTDLWARGDTEIKDGRVVAKLGETAVAILTTTLSGLFSCAYQRRGTIILSRPSGKLNTDGSESRLDLIELSPSPKIEPWEFHEIPVRHWFRRNGSPVAFPCGPVDESDGTICLNDIWENVGELLLNYEHCPTHCGTFEPCGKVV